MGVDAGSLKRWCWLRASVGMSCPLNIGMVCGTAMVGTGLRRVGGFVVRRGILDMLG